MTNKLVIEKSWYYSCGRKYDWEDDGFSQIGLGIARPWLKNNKTLVVTVDGKDYNLDCEKALSFINKYRCFEMRGGVLLGYVSQSLFEPV